MENLLNKIKVNLKKKGYKLTFQRQKILDVIINNKYKHLTSEEVYKFIKDDYPEIALATVYRTIQLLEEANVLCKFDISQSGIKYEVMELDNKHQHPHFICTSCKRIFPIKEDGIDLEFLESKLNDKYKFKMANCNIKLYGIFKKCRGL